MKDDQILLTVVVPTTNAINHVGLLTNWLSEISELPVEAIIVHDVTDVESSSRLAELITELSNPKIRLVEGRFGGPGNARNTGMLLANGEWIAFWDSDDLPKPKLATNILLKLQTNRRVVCMNYEVSNKRNNSVFPMDSPKSIVDLVIQGGIWRYFFRKDFVANTKFGQFRMGEDYLFLARLDLRDTDITTEKEVVYRYNIGNTFQLTSNPLAISELSKTIRELETENLQENGNQLNYLIYMRLCLTDFLKSPVSRKPNCMIKILVAMFEENLLSRSHRVILVSKLVKGLVSARS